MSFTSENDKLQSIESMMQQLSLGLKTNLEIQKDWQSRAQKSSRVINNFKVQPSGKCIEVLKKADTTNTEKAFQEILQSMHAKDKQELESKSKSRRAFVNEQEDSTLNFDDLLSFLTTQIGNDQTNFDDLISFDGKKEQQVEIATFDEYITPQKPYNENREITLQSQIENKKQLKQQHEIQGHLFITSHKAQTTIQMDQFVQGPIYLEPLDAELQILEAMLLSETQKMQIHENSHSVNLQLIEF